MMNESLAETRRDFLSPLERDLTIIRRDLFAVLQETANVRATMTEISSLKRGASKRFVVWSGLICFMISVVFVVFGSQLRSWLHLR